MQLIGTESSSVTGTYPDAVFVAFSEAMLPLSCAVAEFREGQASPGRIPSTHATAGSSSDNAIFY